MPLTDPELDLLLEMLEEDAGAEVYLQVGEELVRRSRWADAARVLRGGLRTRPDPRGWEHLARAALEISAYEECLGALAHLAPTPRTNPEGCRVEILALERSGRLEEARDRASAFLDFDPHDVVVVAVIERLTAPPPTRSQRAADPFYTVERAEQYVALGRTDRAVRVYRKILLANPGNPSIELRMRQLSLAPADVEDDLSRELTDPGLVPELPDTEDAVVPVDPAAIDMPAPRRQSPVSEDGPTDTPPGPRLHTPSNPPPPTPGPGRSVARSAPPPRAHSSSIPPSASASGRPGLPSQLGGSDGELPQRLDAARLSAGALPDSFPRDVSDEETVLGLPRVGGPGRSSR